MERSTFKNCCKLPSLIIRWSNWYKACKISLFILSYTCLSMSRRTSNVFETYFLTLGAEIASSKNVHLYELFFEFWLIQILLFIMTNTLYLVYFTIRIIRSAVLNTWLFGICINPSFGQVNLCGNVMSIFRIFVHYLNK